MSNITEMLSADHQATCTAGGASASADNPAKPSPMSMEDGGTAAASLDRATDGEVVDSDDETARVKQTYRRLAERLVARRWT